MALTAPGDSYEVIICGYGPTGAVAANLLGQRGVRVLVLERLGEIMNIPRAVHFDGEVMRIFQSLGLAPAVQEISHPASGIRFIDGKGKTLIEADFSEDSVRHAWPRGHYFSQPELEARLRTAGESFDSVETRLGWEVLDAVQDDSGVEVTARCLADDQTRKFHARYLLACDGGSSALRAALGGEMRKLGQSSNWLVCDTLLDRDIGVGKPMYQVCDPARPATVEPCNGRHVRWEFQVLPADSAEELESEAYSRSLAEPLLRLVDPTLRPSGMSVVRSKVYTFRSAVATRWRYGNIFLMGDAAHLTPPFLGQGMCAGIRDGFNLCWKLHGVLRGAYQPGLLDSYESERSPHVTQAIRDAAGIALAIQARNPFAAWIRNNYLRLRRWLPVLANPMETEASWSLGPGLFDDGACRAPERDRHNLFDQAEVTLCGGERQRIDELLGDGFAVLLFASKPGDVMAAELLEKWTGPDLRLVRILPRGLAARHPGEVTDSTGRLERWRRRVGGVDLALVRPDRQVYGRYRGTRGELRGQLEAALERLADGLDLRPG